MHERVDGCIAMIALFEGGNISPLRLKWNDRTYYVAKVTGRWVVHKGENRQVHFSLLCRDSNLFEVSYDSKNASWRMCSVALG